MREGPSGTIAKIAAEHAPLDPRHAAALVLGTVDAAVHSRPSDLPSRLNPDLIEVDERQKIHLLHDGDPGGRASPHAQGVHDAEHLGADVGELLFLLLVGRPPRGAEDAFEPHIRASLSPQLVSLLARACSSAPGQWPMATEWIGPLQSFLGSASRLSAPRHTAARRRRNAITAAALVALILVSAIVLWMTPRWWDTATEGGFGSCRTAIRYPPRSNQAGQRLDSAYSF